MKREKPDIPTKAREDVQDGKYDPPHQGSFLTGTILGRGRTEQEKHDRKVYRQSHEREKKRRG